MGEVIPFPNSGPHTWSQFGPIVRDSVIKLGGSAALADWVSQDMRPRFEAAVEHSSISLSLPDQPEVREAVAQLTTFMHDVSNKWIAQMIALEVELGRAIDPKL